MARGTEPGCLPLLWETSLLACAFPLPPVENISLGGWGRFLFLVRPLLCPPPPASQPASDTDFLQTSPSIPCPNFSCPCPPGAQSPPLPCTPPSAPHRRCSGTATHRLFCLDTLIFSLAWPKAEILVQTPRTTSWALPYLPRPARSCWGQLREAPAPCAKQALPLSRWCQLHVPGYAR